MPPMLANAVVLDAYGTLLDTGDASIRATAEILRKHRLAVPPTKFYAEWKRRTRELRIADGAFRTEAALFADALGGTCEAFGIGSAPVADVNFMLATWGTRDAYPDAAEAIRGLRRRWRVYVASNSDTAPLVRDLERNGLAVEQVFSSERLRCYKPAPRFYRAVLDATGLASAAVVWAGDSEEGDVNGPTRFGMRAVRVHRSESGRTPDDSATVQTVHDLKELAALLEVA